MKPKDVRTGIYLPGDVAEEAKRLARQDDRPFSQWLRRLIIKEVERHRRKYIR